MLLPAPLTGLRLVQFSPQSLYNAAGGHAIV